MFLTVLLKIKPVLKLFPVQGRAGTCIWDLFFNWEYPRLPSSEWMGFIETVIRMPNFAGVSGHAIAVSFSFIFIVLQPAWGTI